MASLEELLDIQMNENEASENYTLQIYSAESKFTQHSRVFNEDLLLGLIIQRGIQDQAVASTMMARLENEISNQGKNPNLAVYKKFLKSSFQKHCNQINPPRQDAGMVFHQAFVKNSMPSSSIYDGDSIEPAALETAIWGISHNCKMLGHFSRDCHTKRDKSQIFLLSTDAPQF
ncbi:hypothetical protein O181_000808 [Austropuccinia psidii MF-1]|uniref:CCHC-type domain-containing protein n=1 Tax=Austropuccinia psidii MF-1 TaxID=1389203 RepID=A0A9Q3GB64_9BASI|nr:hypothetical protein [Austropuccinia psidii MF-1]